MELYPDNGLVTDWCIFIRSATHSPILGLVVECTMIARTLRDFRNDLYFVSIAKSAAVLAAKGCRHMVYWAQGIAPEEDYLRFNNKLRRFAFNVCEKMALCRAGAHLHGFDAMSYLCCAIRFGLGWQNVCSPLLQRGYASRVVFRAQKV
ncbi:MAG: hypothetical protein ACLTSX_14105 [Collinsella sp.]